MSQANDPDAALRTEPANEQNLDRLETLLGVTVSLPPPGRTGLDDRILL